MSADDYWRSKAEADKQRSQFYEGLRKKDHAGAIRAAAPDKYVDYLKMKQAHAGSHPASPAAAPALSQEEQKLVEAKQKNLCELIESTGRDIHARAQLIARVFAIDRTAKDAFEQIERLRKDILSL